MSATRPNIVFMLLDNIGFGDPGCYGGGITRRAPTPRIDQMAAEGLRLTNFNVECECTPTRAALMTGRLPIRSGCQRANPPGLPTGLAPWEYTLAELLHDSGYRTAIYGKWHLGATPDRHPTAAGFDEWFGIQDSTAPAMYRDLIGYEDWMITPSVWEGSAGSPAEAVGEYDVERRRVIDSEITERSTQFIARHAGDDQPFFLYIPFTQVHHPALPHPDFEGASGNGDFADSMMEIDYRTGEVLDAIDDAGIGDDTIVVWASDNGPILVPSMGPQADSGPFRGFLGSAYEGQVRVPGIVRWPGHIEAGRVSDEIVAILDFYATFAHLADAESRIPDDRAIDSIDQTEFLLGAPASAREHVLCFVGDDLAALKWHQFKLHFIEYGSEPGHRYRIDLATPQLFNLAQDPKESWDIMEPNTWITQAAVRHIGAYRLSLFEHANVPVGGSGPDAATTKSATTPRG